MKPILLGATVISALALAAIFILFRSSQNVTTTTRVQIRQKEEISVLASVLQGEGSIEESIADFVSPKSSPTSSKSTREGWKCCVSPYAVNDLHNHPTAQEAQDSHHDYSCPENPSNFSWYYNNHQSFDRSKWKKASIIFVGGSTTRQMHEQFKWEMHRAAENSEHNYAARFLFAHEEVGGCCNYDRSHILDTRSLHPELIANLQSAPDFLVFNVATWWATKAIGTVIDENGVPWSIRGTPTESEWQIADQTASIKPDFSFATMMGRAIQMMKDLKHPRTSLVWRSEGTTDCPVGGTFRASVGSVLNTMQVPVLNISQTTCDYLVLRENYDKENKGPHLCFPSVALRHWLLQFQAQFL